MKMHFDPPTIVGALCEREGDIPRSLASRFARSAPDIALLPFLVERRHLTNIVACMQLMDISGIAVCGGHQLAICASLPKLDDAAARSHRVHAVVRRGRAFVGRDAIAATISRWLRDRRPRCPQKTALISGKDPAIPSIAAALHLGGWRIAAQEGDRPLQLIVLGAGARIRRARRTMAASATPLVIDLRKGSKKGRGKSARHLERSEFLGLFYQEAVDLLTEAAT